MDSERSPAPFARSSTGASAPEREAASAVAPPPAPFDRERYLQQLQALHGLRDELGLDEVAFRDLLERVSGSRSARWLTPSQRERAVALLRLHREFEALTERVDAARAALADGLAPVATEVLPKRVRLDGREMARLRASVEEVLELVRFHHPGARLVGVREVVVGGASELLLDFCSPAASDAAEAALPRAA